MNQYKKQPLVLTGAEVNAVLHDGKTQHRMLVDLSYCGQPEFMGSRDCDKDLAANWGWDNCEDVDILYLTDLKCPLGTIGDRLWVQEFHARTDRNMHLTQPHYYADGPLTLDLRHDAGLLIKCSAADMPEWASRLLLEITDIRMEKVNNISEADAIAEGCIKYDPLDGCSGYRGSSRNLPLMNDTHRTYQRHTDAFECLWSLKHDHDSWKRNAWVFVVDFEVVKQLPY